MDAAADLSGLLKPGALRHSRANAAPARTEAGIYLADSDERGGNHHRAGKHDSSCAAGCDGFIPLPDQPPTLFPPLESLRQALA